MSTVSLIAFGFFRKQSRYAGLWTMLQEWGKSIGDWTLNVEHSPNLKSTYLYMMSLADGIGWFQLCKLLNQELDNLCHHCQRKFSVKRSCMLLCVGGMSSHFCFYLAKPSTERKVVAKVANMSQSFFDSIAHVRTCMAALQRWPKKRCSVPWYYHIWLFPGVSAGLARQ